MIGGTGLKWEKRRIAVDCDREPLLAVAAQVLCTNIHVANATAGPLKVVALSPRVLGIGQ